MNRRLIIRAEAESDIIDAAVWYESREAGLGFEVSAELHVAIKRALEHPTDICFCANIPRFAGYLRNGFPIEFSTSSAPTP